MANYIVSYDLNRPRPTHAEMDKHMTSANWSCARILETVWHVGTGQTAEQVYEYVRTKLSGDDPLIVVQTEYAVFERLLEPDASFLGRWQRHAP